LAYDPMNPFLGAFTWCEVGASQNPLAVEHGHDAPIDDWARPIGADRFRFLFGSPNDAGRSRKKDSNGLKVVENWLS